MSYGDALPHTMTVGELREALSDIDDDVQVVMQYNYGDYHNTPAVEVIQEVELKPLTKSAYSRTGWQVCESDDDDDDDDTLPTYLVLSCR